MDEPILDCLIIGGGPAGLTAAIYLARFHLDILVVDGGKSRASWIPCTRNHAGYPEGISGTDLLERMREQACKYGAKVETEFVTKLERDESTGQFTATWGSGTSSPTTTSWGPTAGRTRVSRGPTISTAASTSRSSCSATWPG